MGACQHKPIVDMHPTPPAVGGVDGNGVLQGVDEWGVLGGLVVVELFVGLLLLLLLLLFSLLLQ